MVALEICRKSRRWPLVYPYQSGHADSVIKRYHRTRRLLEHNGDFAIDGRQIPKHKGYIGAVVSLDDMREVNSVHGEVGRVRPTSLSP